MSAVTLTLRGRNRANLRMIDACTITRVTGSSTDPQTGVVTPTLSTIYTGACLFQHPPQPGLATSAVVGEAQLYQLPMAVHVPVTVTGVQVGDIVTATASVLDADLVGRKFWLRELAHKTYMTARRLGIEEVTG